MMGPSQSPETGAQHSPEHPTGTPELRSPAEEGTASDLQLAVVRDDGLADRETIYPAGSTGIERMETWLSVDTSLIVDAAAWR